MTEITDGEGIDRPNAQARVLSSTSKLKMAPFGVSFQRGSTPTQGEGSIAELDWAQQVRIARTAEAAGLEAIIAAARWRGYGGESKWCHESYEGLPWATGIGGATERLTVFSTVHVPLLHPLREAKEMVTVDHVTGGCYGLNVVSGWNIDEFAMFGLVQEEHDDRYAQAAEWITILKRLWAGEQFDFHGRFYDGREMYSAPLPLQRPRPPIMNAGGSPAGRRFAAGHADLCFISALTLDGLREAAEDIHNLAAEFGREVQIWTTAGVLCGETEADVRRQYDYYVHETGDWASAEASLRDILAGGSRTIEMKITPEMIESRIFGSFGPRLLGTPEQIVETMQTLVDAGIDGVAAIWFDYERGIEAFRDLVVPLAVKAGLREPAPG